MKTWLGIGALAVGGILGIVAAVLLFNTGIQADEQGTSGANPFAWGLMFLGLAIFIGGIIASAGAAARRQGTSARD